jgi:hypothetical protein
MARARRDQLHPALTEGTAMHTSQAQVATAAASRYLVQLCKHWAHKLDVEYTSETARIQFPSGLCRMKADAADLLVIVEAADADTVSRLQGVVEEHLRRFAFREQLGTFAWTSSAATQPSE